MKAFSKSEKWDAASILIQYDPAEVQHGEETSEEYTKQVIVPAISKAAIVEVLVRREFSVSDEIAILRQRSSKKAEFDAYNARVEAIKAEADEILAGLAE